MHLCLRPLIRRTRESDIMKKIHILFLACIGLLILMGQPIRGIIHPQKNSENNQVLWHQGTGKVFVFSPDLSFLVYDLLPSACWKRGSKLTRFPKEFQNLIVSKVLGKSSGSYEDFEVAYGPLVLTDEGGSYVRGGQEYRLIRMEQQPDLCSEETGIEANSAESFLILTSIFEYFYPSFESRGINWPEWKASFEPKFETAPNGAVFFRCVDRLLYPISGCSYQSILL